MRSGHVSHANEQDLSTSSRHDCQLRLKRMENLPGDQLLVGVPEQGDLVPELPHLLLGQQRVRLAQFAGALRLRPGRPAGVLQKPDSVPRGAQFVGQAFVGGLQLLDLLKAEELQHLKVETDLFPTVRVKVQHLNLLLELAQVLLQPDQVRFLLDSL